MCSPPWRRRRRISLELTILLSKSILRPIRDLQRATEAVSEGRYDVRVPVTTADELGELAASFNEMVTRLSERERIQTRSGCISTRRARYILSEGSRRRESSARSRSVLRRGEFPGFASQASATEVVERLNDLFEIIVPVVTRHGGHVDKFEGDGLLAVFGAPEPFPDHADRAVAAVEMAARVTDATGSGSRSVSV